jgi:RimJ/RimL family protein N-acetyltransferase/catechol 2,3-dioxygenase-like lactoylglutathione lyase family enzyme
MRLSAKFSRHACWNICRVIRLWQHGWQQPAMVNDSSLSTSRLRLTALALEHASELYRVFADETTLRYWHHLPHRTIRDTEEMIRGMVAAPEACWWAIQLPESNHVIGFVGFLGTTIPGMGYILHADYWRQGYGTEAVAAALEYGFTVLSLNRVELWIHEGNVASQQLARKLGFAQRGHFYGRYPHNARAHETRVFGLRADEWAAHAHKQPGNASRDIPFLNVHPRLPVKAVVDSIVFYRDRLGFSLNYVSGNPPEFAIMARGEWSSEQVYIQLQASEETVVFQLFIMIGPSIDRLHEEYLGKGVTIVYPPLTQPWGIREFTIEDNSGHRITFGSNA